jgi:hypothetical protein
MQSHTQLYSPAICMQIAHYIAYEIPLVNWRRASCCTRRSWRPGTEFSKCFHNSSTIIPSTILPQAKPDAPNSTKRGRIVKKLWKNCGRIIERFCGPSSGSAAGKNCRNIFGWARAKSFYNFSTILSRRAAQRERARKICLQFFHNSSLLTVYPSGETKIPQQFWERIVEEFGTCQIRGRIFLIAAD